MKYLIFTLSLLLISVAAVSQKADNFNTMADNPVGKYYTQKDSLFLIVKYDSVYYNGKMQAIISCENIKTYNNKKHFMITVKSEKYSAIYIVLLQKAGSVYSFAADDFKTMWENTLTKKY